MDHGRSMIAAALRSPLAVFVVPLRSWGWVALYLAACALILGGTAALLVAYQDQLRHAALAYVFPQSWIPAAELVVDRFFSLQARTVIINGVLGLSLMLVTTTLFWSKELMSASFEKNAGLVDEPMAELTLREQAWQEIKLFALFLAAQAIIFWIGYGGGPGRASLARVLSYVVLFATYAIDFSSPLMQRHQGRYSRILKTLVRHPIACLVFGAIFALPPVIAGHLLIARTDWSLAEVVAALFAINVGSITWAAIAGTYFGAQLFPVFRTVKRASPGTRYGVTAVVLLILAVNAYAFAGIGMAVHHKSQLLKCNYDVDFSTIGIDPPSLRGALLGKPSVGVHIDVIVENPTDFDVEIEDNRVELAYRGERVGTSSLSPIRVPAGETVRQRMDATLRIDLLALRHGRGLLDADDWSITLYLEVAPGFDFPIYLVQASSTY